MAAPKIPLGDDFVIFFDVKRADKITALDITGGAFTFSVKDSLDNATYVFQKKNLAAGGDDTQITINDGPGGLGQVNLVPIDTENLDPGFFECDLVMVLGGKRNTIWTGKIELVDHPNVQ